MQKKQPGVGWKFPIEVDAATGRIKMASPEDDIIESIRLILETTKGERIMRPEFGSRVREFIFGSTDDTTLRMMEASVRESILQWEARVSAVQVRAEFIDGESEQLVVHVSYTVRRTGKMETHTFALHNDT